MSHTSTSKKYRNVPNKLPPQIQALFAPGPPLIQLPAIDERRRKRSKHSELTGISGCVDKFEQEEVQYDAEGQKIRTTKYEMPESRRKRKERIKRENAEKAEKELRKALQSWDPNNDTKATSEPFNTLFIAKMNYETTEETLRNAFSKFGPIKAVRVVRDSSTGKSRGYAFIEFEKHEDMRDAYNRGDGMEIDQWRVMVDVERGRTVKDWKPRRLGGGLGNSREPLPPVVEEKQEERPHDSGFRRGGRGGFRGGRGGGGFRRGYDRGGDDHRRDRGYKRNYDDR
ncbi:hypothetical protein C9374_009105 [Naegleria lovaniensis]|uniref:RRM domain-containing protein n=1 Tax=Naegleria lovaniensis TaxID=51637 RepID=A0AA88GAE2_NAELO|nr:uncharacterized protein C9374_014681 [Naegleria lovaniensis]XP_044544851.1 uncharacterized protein C9374_009105 [Naegleria lovaniensis]KAG2370665.1 hypothetical protein C9374_014681 [Naegleria lovaniensis]KAG2377589.1 hypothetical protein C9374_009105 [Naegleria lovaniensis]